MNKFYLFFYIFLFGVAVRAGSSESAQETDLILQPLSAFQIPSGHGGQSEPTFLAGSALILANEQSSVRFVYGKINFQPKTMIVLAKEDDRYSIQNLNEEIVVELKYGSKIRISPYFEMILRRDMSSGEGFVIEQFRPLDLKSHLLRFQRITKASPPVLISYGRRLKSKIEMAKVQYAEASQESASRKPAAVDPDVDVRKKTQAGPTKKPKSLRKRFEEKALGHTL